MFSVLMVLSTAIFACSGGDASTSKRAVRAGYCDAYVRYVCDCRQQVGPSACKSIKEAVANNERSMESQCQKLLKEMKKADKGKEIICKTE